MAKKTNNVKKTLGKVKAAYENIDEQEKELIKESGKKVIGLIEDAIKEKKETGKIKKELLLGILASIFSLVSLTYTAVQPDAISYTDEVATEINTKVDSVIAAKDAEIEELEKELNIYKDNIQISKDGSSIKLGK